MAKVDEVFDSITKYMDAEGFYKPNVPTTKEMSFENLDMDDIDFIELIMALEQKYNIEIDNKDLDESKSISIGELCKIVELLI